MSLLNQALRDLEKREQPLPDASVRAVAPVRSRRWVAAVPGAALALAVVSLSWWWMQDAGDARESNSVALAGPEQPAARPAVTAPAGVPAIVPAVVPATGIPTDAEADARVIEAGDREQSDPAIPRPLSVAGNAPAVSPFPATAGTSRAAGPAVADTVAGAVANEGVDAPAPTTAQPVSGPTTATIIEPTVASTGETVAADSSTNLRLAQSPSRQTSPEPRMRPAELQADASGAGDDAQSSIRVRRAGSPADPTRDTLDSARRALARGRPEIAIAQLQEELEREPRSVEARVLLARTLAATGRAGRAEQVLEEGLEAGPELSAQAHDAAFWLARMRMQRGAVQSAATVLAAHRPSRQGHADYHLLEAAALRELGRHDQALAGYRAVAEAEPANGRAWLGAGLSHEALDQREAAAAAYARALAGDHPGSAAFATQRLQALEHRGMQRDPSNPNR